MPPERPVAPLRSIDDRAIRILCFDYLTVKDIASIPPGNSQYAFTEAGKHSEEPTQYLSAVQYLLSLLFACPECFVSKKSCRRKAVKTSTAS
jgi:hypothetical protein